MAARRDNRWYQAHVSGVLSDGRVAVRFSGERFDAKLPRSDLRLPPEVKAPNLPVPLGGHLEGRSVAAEPSNEAHDFRQWTDRSGTFQIEARFAGKSGEDFRLVEKTARKSLSPWIASGKPIAGRGHRPTRQSV